MLDAEESTIRKLLANDPLGLHLRTAIAELDWYFYNLSRTVETNEEQEEQFYFLTVGVRRLIQLALDSRTSFVVPTVTFPRDKKRTMAVLEVVAHLGFIEHGRRVADLTARGECQIARTLDRFEFTLPSRLVDAAFHERAVAANFRSENRRLSAERFSTPDGRQHLQFVSDLLEENVRVWRDHFIGYHADPILDEHFFALGYEALAESEGYDTFHGSVQFGGIPYQKYCLATSFFLSLSLKHEGFCQALVRKHPDIRLENILTITCERDGLADSIAEALNMMGSQLEGYVATTPDEAREICRVLSVDRASTGLLARSGFTLPFAIEFSDTGYIRSLAGAQMAPAQFMLEALRYHFPREYDQHQRKREASMQRALARILDADFGGLDYRQNITLRVEGRTLTDIDLVVTDNSFGVIFLVQLKFQDLYGGDLRAERTRSERLLAEADRWLSAVEKWLASVGHDRIKSALRLPKKFEISQVYRLIVTRHFAHPLSRLQLDEHTAYATWLQLVNAVELMKRDQGSIKTLSGLFRMLRKHVVAAPVQEHQSEDATEYNLDSLKFVVRQGELPSP